MTLQQLESRVASLEREVMELKAQVAGGNGKKKEPWWISEAGRFADDPVFDEICRLGREWRESQRPGAKKKPKTTGKRR